MGYARVFISSMSGPYGGCGELVIEGKAPLEQLVHLAPASRIEQQRTLSPGQPRPQVDLDREPALPGHTLDRTAMDLDVNPLWRDPLVRCNCSDREHNSTAQRGGHQLDRATVGARLVIPPLDVQQAIAHTYFCVPGPIADLYHAVRCRQCHVPLPATASPCPTATSTQSRTR